jgi:flagellar hook-associated protein 3 FlgL
MRLSNNMIYQSNISRILDNQQKVAIAQEKVSTQTRILAPSDDPAASAQALLFNEKIVINEQYQTNNGFLMSRLETEESVLQNLKNALQRAQVLTIQAGDGAHSGQDRITIAEELKSLQATMFDLMNAKSEDGRYIFSGYQDNRQAYFLDTTTGKYTYQGDQGNHEIQLAVGVSVRASDNGADVFENVFARLNVDTASYTGGVNSVYISEQARFDVFHRNNYDPVTPANNTLQIAVTAGAPDQYSVTLAGNVLATGDFNGESINFEGMNIATTGVAPFNGTVDLAAPRKENMLNTMENLISGLTDQTLTNSDRQSKLADALTGLNNALNQVSITQAGVGGRLNVAERLYDAISDININHKESKAELVELDMAEAITELTREETALQAAQATFGRLSQLSLFDYIR